MVKQALAVAVGFGLLGTAHQGYSQATGTKVPPAAATHAPATGAQAPGTPAQGAPGSGKPLQLQSLDAGPRADPFPPTNPKFFTADSPSVATVDSYLKAVLGYDANRIWRVVAIQKTAAPGVTKVTTLVSDRAANSKVNSAVFFITPDGKHLITLDQTGGAVSPFGAVPFAENRAILEARADGPAHGAAAKDLMLVEFSDLQCVHCKEAQASMTRLAQDFPKARIVFQNFPLAEIHPQAFEAAAYGVCVAKGSNDAFFKYAQAVYDTQAGLTAEAVDQTLKAAVTKAGADPAAIASCAATEATKNAVLASSKLAMDLGVEQTPMLAVNGRLLPLASIPYETLHSLVAYQASLDGIAGTAPVARPAPALAPR